MFVSASACTERDYFYLCHFPFPFRFILLFSFSPPFPFFSFLSIYLIFTIHFSLFCFLFLFCYYSSFVSSPFPFHSSFLLFIVVPPTALCKLTLLSLFISVQRCPNSRSLSFIIDIGHGPFLNFLFSFQYLSLHLY